MVTTTHSLVLIHEHELFSSQRFPSPKTPSGQSAGPGSADIALNECTWGPRSNMKSIDGGSDVDEPSKTPPKNPILSESPSAHSRWSLHLASKRAVSLCRPPKSTAPPPLPTSRTATPRPPARNHDVKSASAEIALAVPFG